jgi:hypothetical protein
MLNSHTHCQVAPTDTQAKTWQRVCLFQPVTDRQSGRKKNAERTTKCIYHKGFSGDSSVVARSKFRVGGQDTTPQSLTAHTLDRYLQS